MLSFVEPFATAELAYRRERIGADFARANAAQTRRNQTAGAASRGRRQRPAYRLARARG